MLQGLRIHGAPWACAGISGSAPDSSIALASNKNMLHVWLLSTQAADTREKTDLAFNTPRSVQIGRHGEGVLTTKQQCDLALLVRLRLNSCTPRSNTELLTAFPPVPYDRPGVRLAC